MKRPYKIAAALFTAAAGASLLVYRLNYRIPWREYTANALYMGVLDDAICRQELGNLVAFPSERKSLPDRYHLFLQLNRRKSGKKMEQEIRNMERRLNEGAAIERSQMNHGVLIEAQGVIVKPTERENEYGICY